MIHAKSPARLVRAAKKVRSKLEKKTSQSSFAGMCGLGSVELVRELRRQGEKAVIAENSAHCFVLSQNFVVDVTACQFGFHRVVVWPAQEAVELSKVWQAQRVLPTISKFNRHQKKYWIKEQWALAQGI